MKLNCVTILLICTCLLIFAKNVRAERCANGLVAKGNTKYEVLIKCGEPAFKDERTEDRISRTGPGETVRSTVRIEEWTYNFGSNKFLRIFTFQNGALIRITTRGYGTTKPLPKTKDPGRQVQVGDSKYEVLTKLGEPVDKNVQEIERRIRTKDGGFFNETVVIETWTFDFGANRFIRFVEFENGRVLRIDHGSYGSR